MPIFKIYPSFKEKLPHVALGNVPTPVQKMKRLGEEIGAPHLYIKRDDVSGKPYGGNKVRKLEFLLGDALRNKTKYVLTFGCAGSNHALATGIYAKQLGIKSISILRPQPNAHYVRKNLLLSYFFGLELHQYPNKTLLYQGARWQRFRHLLKDGRLPYVIPVGGSSPLGTVGFVNAAFEIKEQVTNGEFPEPDYVYVASGTMGTATGLLLGFRAANMKTKVISVRVNDASRVNKGSMLKLLYDTNALLHSADSSFPIISFTEQDITIHQDFFGKEYALFTKEGAEAINRIEKSEGITLEGTYTGKTLAALIHDAGRRDWKDKAILFWNTYNSLDIVDTLDKLDYRKLPSSFHRYFEEAVQPLDK